MNENFHIDLAIDKGKLYKSLQSHKLYKVNDSIWARKKDFNRQGNSRLPVLQDSLVRVSSVLSMTIDKLLKSRERTRPL